MVAEIAFVFVVVALALPGLVVRAFELAIHVSRLGQSHVPGREVLPRAAPIESAPQKLNATRSAYRSTWVEHV
jgi:hypothetical protein